MTIDRPLLRKQRDTLVRQAAAEPNPLAKRRLEERAKAINRTLGIDEDRPHDPIVIRQKRALEIAEEKRAARLGMEVRG